MSNTSFQRSLVIVSGYVCTWLLGPVLGALFGILVLLGAVRIRGYRGACEAIGEGNLVIASNHPSLLETFLIPLTFVWPALYNTRYFLWSLPDRHLFGRGRLIYALWRCIRINRDKGAEAREDNSKAIDYAAAVLSSGFSIVVHPEGGRTLKGATIERSHRRMRRVSATAAKLAHRIGGRILPVWVEMRENMQRDLPGFAALFVRLVQPRYWPVTITFGKSYATKEPFDQSAERERLQNAIFDT
jgi:1-acyl-sn-glycerol-3-phosphate acyltransferase